MLCSFWQKRCANFQWLRGTIISGTNALEDPIKGVDGSTLGFKVAWRSRRACREWMLAVARFGAKPSVLDSAFNLSKKSLNPSLNEQWK